MEFEAKKIGSRLAYLGLNGKMRLSKPVGAIAVGTPPKPAKSRLGFLDRPRRR
jgi:hypothetical protein